MKNIVAILIVALLVIISGCASQQTLENDSPLKEINEETQPSTQIPEKTSEPKEIAKILFGSVMNCREPTTERITSDSMNCLYDEIINNPQANDFTVCEDLKDFKYDDIEWKSEASRELTYVNCLVGFSMKQDSTEPCESIIPLSEKKNVDYCIQLLSTESKDIYKCDKVKNIYEKDNCYMSFLFHFAIGNLGSEIDPIVCTEKLGESWRVDCIMAVKQANGNFHCKKLSTQEDVSNCIEDLNSKLNECKKIQDKNQKFECYNNI